jgi:purine nucleoside phosphorylase
MALRLSHFILLGCWPHHSSEKRGKNLAQAEIGIIGGSGLYSMPGFTDIHEVQIDTPFGAPSDPFVLGELEGR